MSKSRSGFSNGRSWHVVVSSNPSADFEGENRGLDFPKSGFGFLKIEVWISVKTALKLLLNRGLEQNWGQYRRLDSSKIGLEKS